LKVQEGFSKMVLPPMKKLKRKEIAWDLRKRSQLMKLLRPNFNKNSI